MNNLSVWSLQGLLLVFLDKRDNLANRNEEFYNLSIKKILVTIDGMPHHLFAAGELKGEFIQSWKNIFTKNILMYHEEFLTTKFALWIDTHSSTDNTLHGCDRVVEQSGILLQIEKAPKTSGYLTCHVFSLEDAVAHLSVTNPSGILTTEK